MMLHVKHKQLNDLLLSMVKFQDKTLVQNHLQPEMQLMLKSWLNRLRSYARTQLNLAGKISNSKLRWNKTNKRLLQLAKNTDAKWSLKAALDSLHLVLQPTLWVHQVLVRHHCSIFCLIVLPLSTKQLFQAQSHLMTTFQSTKKHLPVMLPMLCKTIFFSHTSLLLKL